MIPLTLVIILLSNLGLASSAVCDIQNSVINCRARRLDDVPAFDEMSNCTAVYLNYNNISKIPSNAFLNISDTSELVIYLDHNNIAQINDNAFAGLENVSVRLFLEQNSFTNNLPEALKLLNNMTHLSVDGICNISGSVLSAVAPNLKHLSFGLQACQDWPSELAVLTSLNSLEVSGLGFGRIPDDAFGAFHFLEILEIHSSSFNTTLSAICSAPYLQVLTLELIEVEDFLIFLPNCSKPLTSLWMLNIQNVNFPTLPYFFNTFPNLGTLEVSNNNELDFISGDAVPLNNTLTHLRLYNNNLQQIPFIIQKITLLEVLDLSLNSISVIEANDLGNLTNLRVLILSGNPIQDISVNAFELLPSLAMLNLRDTGIDVLPFALSRAKKLSVVDFSHNRISCSCSVNWIMNSSFMGNLRGDCINGMPIVTYLRTKCAAP